MSLLQLTGAAGEFAVCAELSLRGWTCCPLLQNVQGIDILATKGERTIRIQVKTNRSGSPRQWMLSRDCEDCSHVDFYVFVKFNDDSGSRDFYIVPAETVARDIAERHREWLSTPGRGGRARNDSSMRKWTDADGAYKDKWELLG